jgi:hypothetical protein
MNKAINHTLNVFGLFIISLFFLVPLVIAQSEGEWKGVSDDGGAVYFQVSNNEVRGFSIFLYLSGGFGGHGWLETVIGDPMLIHESRISFDNGIYEVTGTFTTPSFSTGTYDHHDPYLGYSSGTWTATFVPPHLSVTPSYQDVSSFSGSTTFEVANVGGGIMSWTAEVDPDYIWLSITSGSSGNNAGTISINFEANEGDARIGKITVASPEAENSYQTVEIRQKANAISAKPWIPLLLFEE